MSIKDWFNSKSEDAFEVRIPSKNRIKCIRKEPILFIEIDEVQTR